MTPLLIEQKLSKLIPKSEISANEPMTRHTSFKIGGPADILIKISDEDELRSTLAFAHAEGLPVTIIGNGTNLLVSDDGIEGIVIKTHDGLAGMKLAGENVIWAGSGVLLGSLALFARSRGLAGLEFAHGIPGTLGGAVYMNAGAYGGEIKQVVIKTTYVDIDGKVGEISGTEHDFSYRHSCFSGKSGLFITGSLIRLTPDDPERITGRMRELSEKRRASQPLELPSAGSVFKRPEGYYAAALIDECGLRGRRTGGAQVSEKHAGFIVNTGGATCRDVLTLIAEIQDIVADTKGVKLEPELRMIGRV